MSNIFDVLEPSYRRRLYRRYQIVAPRKRASHCVALTCTYYPNTPKKLKTLPRIRSTVNRISRMWVQRLWDLGHNGLWLYQRGLSPNPSEIDPDRLIRAFELFADCRSRCVAYMPPPPWAKEIKYKPCNRANFCPHCWAAQSARQTQHIKKIINDLLLRDPDSRLHLTTHIAEKFVSSCGIGGDQLATPEERFDAIVRLREQVDKCKKHIASQYKYVQRHALGSVWRIVVVPADSGWKLQIRQLFLMQADNKPPLKVMHGMRTASKKVAKIYGGFTWKQRKSTESMDSHVYARLIEFNRYPMAWLTDDIELVAIYLNATARCRLLGGRGKFKKIGGALVRDCVSFEKAANDVVARRA